MMAPTLWVDIMAAFATPAELDMCDAVTACPQGRLGLSIKPFCKLSDLSSTWDCLSIVQSAHTRRKMRLLSTSR